MTKENKSVGTIIGNIIGNIFKFFMDIGLGIANIFIKMIDEEEKKQKKNGKRKQSKRK